MIPRIRTIKPEMFKHYLLWQLEQITGLPIIRLYPTIWHASDREARFEWKPIELKVEFAPYDSFDYELVLNVFTNAGFIVKYVGADGRLYGWVPRFLRHQNINGREQDSRIPPPPAEAAAEHEQKMLLFDFNALSKEQLLAAPRIVGSGSVRGDQAGGARSADTSPTREPRVEDASQGERNRTELKGTELKGEGQQPSVAPAVPAATGPSVDARRALENINASDAETPATSEPAPAPQIKGKAGKALALPPIQGKAIAKNVLARFTAVLEEVRDGRREQLRAEQLQTLQAEFIITYWAMVFDKPHTLIDEKRRARVRTRLKENDGDVNELLYAVDGAKVDPHLSGKNDRDRVYDSISTIFRDREMVERLAGQKRKFVAGEQHKMLTKWKEIVAQESA